MLKIEISDNVYEIEFEVQRLIGLAILLGAIYLYAGASLYVLGINAPLLDATYFILGILGCIITTIKITKTTKQKI